MKNHNTNKTNFLITIAGPTAVGKTETTISLSKRYNSDIFSADSRQLYTEMDIGTAKPTLDELASATHHFINHVSVVETYNAGRYERDFTSKIKDYFISKEVGILTGGTGMYLRAALEGLDEFPDVTPQIKEKFAQIFQSEGITALQKLVKAQDPLYAKKVDLNNARRLSRALEVMEVEGKMYSDYLNKKEKKDNNFIPIKICLTRDREELYERINRRVDIMMENGLLNEVKQLIDYKENPSLQTVGYSEIFRHLDGDITLSESIELIKRNSRRYAKRQMTWFRNQGDWTMIDADNSNAITQFIDQNMTN